MIRHIFKITRKNKKGKFLMIAQFVLVYVVLFTLIVMGFKLMRNYFRETGFEYSHLLGIGIESFEKNKPNSKEDNMEIINQIINGLNDCPEIEGHCLIKDFVPFVKRAPVERIKGERQIMKSHIWKADDNFISIFDVKLIAGRWFSSVDNAKNIPPIVINNDLAQELFKHKSPLGKQISIAEKKYEIIGVVESFYPNNSHVFNGLFMRYMKGADKFDSKISIIAKSGKAINAHTLTKINDVIGAILKNKNNKKAFVKSMNKLRDSEWGGSMILIILLGFVVVFLIINMLLGLMATLRHNIRKRLHEIGVRRACGSPKGKIISLIIGELYALFTLSLVPAIFIVMQFIFFNFFHTQASHYYFSVIGSAVILYLLIALISLYPASGAVTMEPAIALHEE